jgi:hypothetical protein
MILALVSPGDASNLEIVQRNRAFLAIVVGLGQKREPNTSTH